MNLNEKVILAGIKPRHLEKVSRFYSEILQLESEIVYNLCCGNALASWYILYKEKNIKVVSIDKTKTRKYERLERLMEDDLKIRHLFLEQDIETNLNGLVIAIHSCGDLTDRIIEMCVKQKCSFAIVPCCYNPDRQILKSKDYKIPSYLSRTEIIDDIRINYLKRNSRDVVIKRIRDFPSQMNKLILSRI